MQSDAADVELLPSERAMETYGLTEDSYFCDKQGINELLLKLVGPEDAPWLFRPGLRFFQTSDVDVLEVCWNARECAQEIQSGNPDPRRDNGLFAILRKVSPGLMASP